MRIGLAIVVAVLLLPAVPPETYASTSSLFLVVAREMAIGLVMALALRAVLAGAERNRRVGRGQRAQQRMMAVHEQERDERQVAVEIGDEVAAHAALRIDDRAVREHQLAARG